MSKTETMPFDSRTIAFDLYGYPIRPRVCWSCARKAGYPPINVAEAGKVRDEVLWTDSHDPYDDCDQCGETLIAAFMAAETEASHE